MVYGWRRKKMSHRKSSIRKITLEEPVLEKLAEAAHRVFFEGMKARDTRPGSTTDGVRTTREAHKTHPVLVPYSELPEHLKEANRRNVRDIPAKLEAVGYVMIPARSNEPPFIFSAQDLERLAEAEHKRWMQSKLEDGWVYAPKTDSARKLHDCLVPWERLPEAEREKDRDLVRGIPAILAFAGYTIARPVRRK